MKIYIIRHGETDANKLGLFQGRTDFPLNDYGVMLAEETGKGLSGIKFDAAYSSPLIRARQTAEILLRETASSCPLFFDDRLMEINAGDYEGRHFRPEYGEINADDIKMFFLDPLHLPPFPNGESVADVVGRTQEFLRELAAKSHKNVLVSTHGCALRCMLNGLYADPGDFWHGHVPYNCVINVVEAIGGEMKLVEDDKVYYDQSLCIDRFKV